jgi:hypothetical protein
MKLSRPLIVKIEDAEFHFQNPGLRAWADFVDLGKKELDEQAAVILNRITKIKGVIGEDGEEMTLEQFLKEEIPLWVLVALKEEYPKALIAMAKGQEAEGKKVPTSDSSGSSDSDSSTPA